MPESRIGTSMSDTLMSVRDTLMCVSDLLLARTIQGTTLPNILAISMIKTGLNRRRFLRGQGASDYFEN